MSNVFGQVNMTLSVEDFWFWLVNIKFVCGTVVSRLARQMERLLNGFSYFFILDLFLPIHLVKSPQRLFVMGGKTCKMIG